MNYLPNFWWQENTNLWAYTAATAAAAELNFTMTLNDAPTSPPYHCQEDVSPYYDWVPVGSQSPPWYNCQRSPNPTGVWHGFANSEALASWG